MSNAETSTRAAIGLPGRALRISLGTAFGAALLAVSAGALAQGAPPDAAQITRGQSVYQENCAQCHGWQGQGAYAGEDLPITGAPLTTSTLSAAEMIEVISCGRPGTGMPTHLRAAWTEQHPCYGGLLKKDIASANFPMSPIKKQLVEKEIQDVVAFIQDAYQGKSMTFDLCTRLNGASKVCLDYKK